MCQSAYRRPIVEDSHEEVKFRYHNFKQYARSTKRVGKEVRKPASHSFRGELTFCIAAITVTGVLGSCVDKQVITDWTDIVPFGARRLLTAKLWLGILTSVSLISVPATLTLMSITDTALATKRRSMPGARASSPLNPKICAMLAVGFLAFCTLRVPNLCKTAVSDMFADSTAGIIDVVDLGRVPVGAGVSYPRSELQTNWTLESAVLDQVDICAAGVCR
mmetsp:Transcript_3596/g.6790  ORF Transcript_3596/g.6790 Transcript_3596/m.6790 type:complete len:220 (+) Transcript_3596:188-847(+)